MPDLMHDSAHLHPARRMQLPPHTEIESRLEWYDRKARQARAAFLSTKVVELLAATAIPVLALQEVNPIMIALLGALIAVLAGTDPLFRSQETWINYRRTAEMLRTELFLYRTGAGPYELPSAEAAARLLANRAADMLAEERGRWETLAQQASIPSRRADSGMPP